MFAWASIATPYANFAEGPGTETGTPTPQTSLLSRQHRDRITTCIAARAAARILTLLAQIERAQWELRA